MKRRFHLLSGLSLILLLGGCMGYQLGGTHPAGVKTVYIAPVINKTKEPAIELQITRALRARLQFDGRLQLKSSIEDADAIVEVVLTHYNIQATAFRPDLETTAQQYRVRIDATSTLKDTKTGEVLSESKTYGETTFDFESDLTSSKRNALPRAAQELAKFISDDLIERW